MTLLNPRLLFRIAAGVGLGYFAVKKLAAKPLHMAAVTTAKGVLNLGDRVNSAGQAVVDGWQDIVAEAKSDIEQKKESHLAHKAGSVMDTVSENVAGYMHKTAQSIEDLADKLEGTNVDDDKPDEDEDEDDGTRE